MEIHYSWKPSRSFPVPCPPGAEVKKLIRRAAEAAGLPVEKDWQASVRFVGGCAMAKANAEFVGHTGETDVITFSYFDDPESLFPGDTAVELLVCIDVAAREGVRRPDSSFGEELALYILHGFLHAAGLDDLTPEARRKMRRNERHGMKILREEFRLQQIFTL